MKVSSRPCHWVSSTSGNAHTTNFLAYEARGAASRNPVQRMTVGVREIDGESEIAREEETEDARGGGMERICAGRDKEAR